MDARKWNPKGWFTLVEIIIVISILAILGTIALNSLHSMSSDARDSKRKTDLANINSAVVMEISKWMSPRTYVSGTGATITDAGTGTSTQIRIAWVEGYPALSGSYVWGDVNYQTLNLVRERVLDPSENVAYKMAMTDYNATLYEIAGTLENGGDPDILTMWTWNPRLAKNSFPGKQSGDTFTLSGTNVTETGLRVKDIVRFNSGALETDKYQIISAQGTVFQFDRTLASSGSTVFIQKDETRHLVKRWKSNSAIKSGSGTDYAPYPLN